MPGSESQQRLAVGNPSDVDKRIGFGAASAQLVRNNLRGGFESSAGIGKRPACGREGAGRCFAGYMIISGGFKGNIEIQALLSLLIGLFWQTACQSDRPTAGRFSERRFDRQTVAY